jgi:ATP-dependent Zn protease
MLGAHDVACFIGCAQLSDVPRSLRQVVDLTLELPRLTPELFAELFERVMGTPPPAGWDAGDAHWVTHVHHADFQHPEGLDLTPEQTLEHIRERATSRLRDVEPVEGLGLSELHGLGEARRFAEDLITDIHQAMDGELDWDQVDRGMLLAGAPGTGKTTLARAIAKDCGIRFVSASAASWQAAGYLNDHIRAMRADFQLARRFAPAILFIDEIDSVGSRDAFSGSNTQYHTQVVNALLEQIQGIDPAAPVIVIAATNHPGRIDPALKRSGRLDHVIEIPRPNAAALADIFRHYLGEYPGEKRADDIDPGILGGMAFGLTGADVERIVRGAARRARRAGRPIQQSDLIDEITRKPRDQSTSPRLTPDEVRRVAVHEAGHALAAYLTASRAEDISFVSIVPRADGTLGFVAQMPSERALVTRQEYLERLEIILGGRAAEEVVFGDEGVTGGAKSDLKVATRSAIQMTTRLGLGPERSLLWADTPSEAQTTEAGQILSDVYATVLGKLRAEANELTALADALEDRQELTGEEVRALLDGRPNS